MSVELPDLSSKYDSESDSDSEYGCDSQTLVDKIKQLEENIEYLKKALDVALKQEPIFVYEHCGHCPKKESN
jgi:hypothetical protein